MHLTWISDGGAGVSSGSHLLFNLWPIVVETAQVKKSHLKLCQICLTNLQHLLSYSEKENRLEKWMWSSFNVLLSKVKMAQIIAAQWDNSKCIRFIKRRQPFMPYSDIEGFFTFWPLKYIQASLHTSKYYFNGKRKTSCWQTSLAVVYCPQEQRIGHVKIIPNPPP